MTTSRCDWSHGDYHISQYKILITRDDHLSYYPYNRHLVIIDIIAVVDIVIAIVIAIFVAGIITVLITLFLSQITLLLRSQLYANFLDFLFLKMSYFRCFE